ncbi:GDPD1 Lysophospholipase, partial [Amia calva]|nr:GDPD1 Lysophospholipase [Amia calva]
MSSYMYYLLPAIGGYTLTSLFFLKNPQLLHKKKRTAFYATHISHRGGGGERIENTMEAFTNAVDCGTELLELDCHLTRDGHVIVSHDENLHRQTGRDVDVSDLNLEVSRHFHLTRRYSTGTDRKFPLLEDVFRKFPHTPVNTEIKEDNERLIKEVSSLVKKYNREDITVWASMKSHILKKCRKENPSMPFMFSVPRGVQLLLLYYCGLLPFTPLPESFLQMYLPCVINRSVWVCLCL